MIDVLALDPSLRSTGWATLHDGRLITGTIRPRPDHGRGPARIAWIAAQIRARVRHHTPRLVAIEGYSMSSHSSAVTKLAELGGVIRTTLWGMNMPYLEVAPATIKIYATGTGNADKHRVHEAACDHLNLPPTASTDEADAAWLLAVVAAAAGLPYLELPDTHTRALTPVTAALSKLDILDPDRTPQEQ